MRTSALERPEAPLAKALFSHRTTRIPRATSAQAMLVPARGGSDLHATSPERAHDVERSGNQLGILGQTVELQRDEVGEHPVDVLLARRPPLRGRPPRPDSVERHAAEVHGRPGPVEKRGADRTPVDPSVGEGHGKAPWPDTL